MQSDMVVYSLVAVGLFLLFAPDQYKTFIPSTVTSQQQQIVAVVALLAAYYYYNGEKLF